MEIEYNSIFRTPEEMAEIAQHYTKFSFFSQDDIEFLKQLYNQKVEAKKKGKGAKKEILAKIFLDFLKHFNMTEWRSYRIASEEVKKKRKMKKRTVLLALMPLKMGEYHNATRALIEQRILKTDRIGNGKRVKYNYYVLEA